MATASKGSIGLEKLGWYFEHCNHAVWDRFSPDEQQAMVDDDLTAARSVSLVLVSLITAGMLLAAVTLVIVVLRS
jgi:hypothetical protein